MFSVPSAVSPACSIAVGLIRNIRAVYYMSASVLEVPSSIVRLFAHGQMSCGKRHVVTCSGLAGTLFIHIVEFSLGLGVNVHKQSHAPKP